MPIFGDLNTMSLPDLLQWAALTQKTGVLEIERNRICRGIEFRKGFIGACSSDDPSNRIGQVLVSRGKITEKMLQEALARQEREGQNLCVILIEMGVLTQSDVARFIAAKAEETIQSLFEWEDAVFRFYEGATLDSNLVEVSLTVNDILLKGLQHKDELKQMRQVFKSSAVVLQRTDNSIPDEVMSRPVARRVLKLIDGERTLSEILRHSYTSEFLAAKLLHKLHQSGLIKIVGERPSSVPTVIDAPAHSSRSETPTWKAPAIGECPEEELTRGRQMVVEDRERVGEAPVSTPGSSLDAEIAVANSLMDRGDYGVAIELLKATGRAHEHSQLVQDLISKAEQAFMETAKVTISSSNVPVFPVEKEAIDQTGLSPDEALMFGLIDQKSDIKSILWLAPMSEMEALRALEKMLDLGMIELRDPGEFALEQGHDPPQLIVR